jgi:hypothetical protein
MAGKRKRQILNMIFSAQGMRKVMPIFWDVTRRVRSFGHTAKNCD